MSLLKSTDFLSDLQDLDIFSPYKTYEISISSKISNNPWE